MATGGTFFEELGFYYVGPIDGHNLDHLVPVLKNVRDIKDKPVLVHVVTQKGQGYAPAEDAADKYHGVQKFDVITGEQVEERSPTRRSYQKVFADELIKHAEQDDKIVAITAAMPSGTGLDLFAKRFPDRTFDVGIAEQHAVTFAAGLAADGMKPFAAIYSTFLQRGYDQVVHDVAIQRLPVRFAMDRAGLVGADGPTHAGSFDVGYLGQLPGFVLMAAADEAELAHMVATAVAIDDRPERLPLSARRGRRASTIPDCAEPLEIGRGRIVREGSAVAILSLRHAPGRGAEGGRPAGRARLSRPPSPTPASPSRSTMDLILRLAREHEALITVEEGAVGRLRRLRAARSGRARRARPRPEGPHPDPARRLPGPGQARDHVRPGRPRRRRHRPRRPGRAGRRPRGQGDPALRSLRRCVRRLAPTRHARLRTARTAAAGPCRPGSSGRRRCRRGRRS